MEEAFAVVGALVASAGFVYLIYSLVGAIVDRFIKPSRTGVMVVTEDKPSVGDERLSAMCSNSDKVIEILQDMKTYTAESNNLLDATRREMLAVRKKFDVLYDILGVNKGVDLPDYLERTPEEESQNAFNEMAQDAMREQGLTYEQAAHYVKSRTAHRRAGR